MKTKQIIWSIFVALIWVFLGFIPSIFLDKSTARSEATDVVMRIIVPLMGIGLAFMSLSASWRNAKEEELEEAEIIRADEVSTKLPDDPSLVDVRNFLAMQPESNWCGFSRTNAYGQHCVLGFLDVALNDDYGVKSVLLMAKLLSPTGCDASDIVMINNNAARDNKNIKKEVLDFIDARITEEFRKMAL